MDKPVIIFGAKGIAKAALEIFNGNNIVCYGFLEDDQALHHTEINGVPVLGSTEDHEFLTLVGRTCDAFIATDDHSIRRELVDFLKDKHKVMPMNAVHRHAVISRDCGIGHGNFINTGVILAHDVTLGQHNIVNTNVVVEQDAKIGDFVQIGAGSVINAGVTIEKGAFIGSGVTVVSGVTIGENARVGAGSVVVGDVKKGQTVFGNPAAEVK